MVCDLALFFFCCSIAAKQTHVIKKDDHGDGITTNIVATICYNNQLEELMTFLEPLRWGGIFVAHFK